MPKTRVEFWRDKFDRNVIRDHEKEKALVEVGWHVLTIWECETRDPNAIAIRLREAFGPSVKAGLSSSGQGQP